AGTSGAPGARRPRGGGAKTPPQTRGPRGGRAGGGEPVAPLRVGDHPNFGRASARTAVSAVAERDESVPICNERTKAINPIAQCAAIAVEIQHHRLFSSRR